MIPFQDSFLDETAGRKTVDRAVERFLEFFPPLAASRGAVSLSDYLAGHTGGMSNAHSCPISPFEYVRPRNVSLW
jgi:hypothetical protein